MRNKLPGFGYAFAGLLVAAAPLGAPKPDPFLGTWVLNVAKSTYTGGPVPKSSTSVYTAMGEAIKVVATGVAADGTETRVEFTMTFDGKDSPVTGTADYDMVSNKRVSSHKIEFTRKKDGKVVQTGTNTVSEDGKTRTVVTDGTNAAGVKIHAVAVYERQ